MHDPEAEISQVKERRRWTLRWERQAVFNSGEMVRTPVTVLTEGSGGQENREISGVQITRSNLCNNKGFQLYPVGTGVWRYWVKPSCSRASQGQVSKRFISTPR